MSLAFAAEGADVVIGDVREDPREGGRPTVELIEEQGGSGVFVEADAARWDDIDRLVRTAVERRGRLDVMVQQRDPGRTALEGASRDDRGGLGRDHGRRPARRLPVLQARRPADARAGAGRRGARTDHQPVVAARHGRRSRAVAYCTAKGGVVNLTRQVAVDYGPQGIIVNAIAPGKILTRPADEPDSPEVLAYSHSRTPFARLGRPADVAAAAVFLASDECSYVSGTNLLVDGGWMAY